MARELERAISQSEETSKCGDPGLDDLEAWQAVACLGVVAICTPKSLATKIMLVTFLKPTKLTKHRPSIVMDLQKMSERIVLKSSSLC